MMQGKPVIVIGAANADIKGFLNDEFDEPTSYPGKVVMSAGGVGRNIAHNLALLGVETSLVAMIGDDQHGQSVTGITAAAGVEMSLVQIGGDPTGVYLAILDQEGQLMGAVNDMRAADGLTAARLESLSIHLSKASFLVADCNIPAESLNWLASFASRNGRRLVIDAVSVPKVAKLLAIDVPHGIHVLVLNEDELEALAGKQDRAHSIADILDRGFGNVVVHCGSRGAIVAQNDGSAVAISPVKPERVVDVTGAGDAAVAGLVYGLASGLDLVTSAGLGQAAASVTVASSQSVAAGMCAETIGRLAA